MSEKKKLLQTGVQVEEPPMSSETYQYYLTAATNSEDGEATGPHSTQVYIMDWKTIDEHYGSH
jgi:hypothetical protein